MRILLCTPTYQQVTHGPAKFAHFLWQINYLYPEYEIRVLTEGVDWGKEGAIYKLKLDYPRPVHAFGKLLRMVSYHRAAMKIYDHYPFDILLYNDAIQGLGSALWSPQPIKVVGMLNDDEYLGTRLSNIAFSRKWLIRWIYRWFEAMATRYLDTTITCSEYLKELVVQQYKTSALSISVLYQSVDLENWSGDTDRPEFTDRPLKILFVKSDYKIGGLQFLIEALQYLPNQKFELVIIGPLQSWRKKVEKLYLPLPYITYTFLGALSQEEVHQYMLSSDILCIPSLREGLGVANIEGLASGIPVVSTRVGGIPEVLGDGAFGWLAAAGDPQSIAAAIKACIESPVERRIKSKKGRQFTEARFDHKIMLKKFITIMNEF